MLSWALALLSVGTVGLHLEDARGVATSTRTAIIEELASAIEMRTGARVARDASDWVSCSPEERRSCIQDVLVRNRGDEVVAIVLVGGITKLRMVAQRFAPAGESAELSLDLSRNSAQWKGALRGLVEKLYPEGAIQQVSKSDPVLPPSELKQRHDRSRLPSWIAIGAAAAAGTLSVVFRVQAANAQDELEGGLHGREEFQDLTAKRRFGTRASNVCLALTGVGAGAAVFFAVFEF